MTRLTPAPEQIEATRPDRSIWVSANAGSGKTHVLTMRVARLLLAGAEPQKILCLTYTKAAAAEMQSRLFQLLGQWAMLEDAELFERLEELSGAPLVSAKDPDLLATARRLFARALETPGGLKIQTIHAFCDSLLRRFPLEAGVSPRFEVAEDRRAREMMAGLRAEMARAAEAGSDPAFDLVAARVNEEQIAQLAEAVISTRAGFATQDPEGGLAAHFGAGALGGEITAAKVALAELDWNQFAALRQVLLDRGKQYDRPVGEEMPLDPEVRAHDPQGAVDRLMRRVLKSDLEPRGKKGFPSVEVKKARPQAEDELENLTAWALRARDSILAARTVARTRDLYAFGATLLHGLDHGKASRQLLDFDDLVARASEMLNERHMRAWVLFKLDQGIDHILIDEAQDTAPPQWEVIRAIADEFFAGEGARPERRSVFVVGDEKQSIYSFQGAQPRAFGAMRAHFEDQLAGVGGELGKPRLETSYRSAPAILDFVDAVFDGSRGLGLTTSGDPVRHRTNRVEDQGRVELWPLVPRQDKPEQPPWYKPVDAVPATDPKEVLADLIAGRILGLLESGRLPAREGRIGRRITAEDILVLVRRRDRLAHAIIRELKERDVPVAGADRLALADELAVKDLLAVMKVALMPSDDLSLGAVLRSPLCELDEGALFTLAHGRKGTLHDALSTAPRFAAEAAFFKEMSNAAGYLRPYEFLERILVHHGGRAKLLARLGQEAEDPIDELLQQALDYETAQAPTLTGFIAWIEAGGIEVKREMDRGAGQIRVMTVHGAKGLEAPIVILPDTIASGRAGGNRPQLFEIEGDGNRPPLTLWAGSKSEDDKLTRELRADQDARDQAERKRLLYVALTRAEDWLILCGADMKNASKDSWYHLLVAGMDAYAERKPAEVTEHPIPTGSGAMRLLESGPTGVGGVPADAAPGAVGREHLAPMPGPAAKEHRRERGNPSTLVQAEEGHGGAGLGREQALLKGSAVHLLLERLAEHGAPAIRREGARLLTAAFPTLEVPHGAAAIDAAARVLEMPEAGMLFGPGSLAEVSVAIDPPKGGLRMIGRIDRLILANGQALVVDIKTDARPASVASDVARAYLAQLGAYASAVAVQWPAHEVSLAILWTSAPKLMQIGLAEAEAAYRSASFGRNSGP